MRKQLGLFLARLAGPMLYRRQPSSIATPRPIQFSGLPNMTTDLDLKPLNPRKFLKTLSSLRGRHEPIVISATVIAARLDEFEKTARSIFSQDLVPDAFFIFISSEGFGLDEGISEDNKTLEKLSRLGVTVVFTANTGPHRKIVPVVKLLRDSNIENPFIVTIDDDIVYPSYMTSQLVEAAKGSDSIVSFRGRFMSYTSHGWKPYARFGIPTNDPHILNLPIGRNGICYRLHQLPDLQNLVAGFAYAPFADDLWMKFCSLSLDVKCLILTPMASFQPKLERDFEQTQEEGPSLFSTLNNASDGNDEVLRKVSEVLKLKFT